jgi:hypothetical protein
MEDFKKQGAEVPHEGRNYLCIRPGSEVGEEEAKAKTRPIGQVLGQPAGGG